MAKARLKKKKKKEKKTERETERREEVRLVTCRSYPCQERERSEGMALTATVYGARRLTDLAPTRDRGQRGRHKREGLSMIFCFSFSFFFIAGTPLGHRSLVSRVSIRVRHVSVQPSVGPS